MTPEWTHVFDGEVAVVVGVPAALLLWDIRNQEAGASGKDPDFHDGLPWHERTMPMFRSTFPFLTEAEIIAALALLLERGIIQRPADAGIIAHLDMNGSLP